MPVDLSLFTEGELTEMASHCAREFKKEEVKATIRREVLSGGSYQALRGETVNSIPARAYAKVNNIDVGSFLDECSQAALVEFENLQVPSVISEITVADWWLKKYKALEHQSLVPRIYSEMSERAFELFRTISFGGYNIHTGQTVVTVRALITPETMLSELRFVIPSIIPSPHGDEIHLSISEYTCGEDGIFALIIDPIDRSRARIKTVVYGRTSYSEWKSLGEVVNDLYRDHPYERRV